MSHDDFFYVYPEVDCLCAVTHRVTFILLMFCGRFEPPRNIERLTLLKSVHIFKKHRVQYEMRTHYRSIEVRVHSCTVLWKYCGCIVNYKLQFSA